MSKSENYYKIAGEFFTDINAGILKDTYDINSIINKLETSLSVNLFLNVLIRVIHSSIYKQSNDNGFTQLFHYYIDILESLPN